LESDVLLLDPEKYAKRGLTADGNARLLLRAQSHQPGYIVFQLSSFQGATLETLDRAHISLGQMAIPGEFIGYDDQDLPIYQATTVLTAPKEFASNYRHPSQVVSVSAWQEDENDYSEKPNSRLIQALHLYDPPVILIHGLWGKEGAFGIKGEKGVLNSLSYPNIPSDLNPVEYVYDGTRGPSDLMTSEEETFLWYYQKED
jgi:hypothetical protein